MAIRTALVVDDAPEYQQSLTALLRGAGIDTATVGTGTAALEAVRSRQPDVVVLDVGLPDMDGIEVCRQLRTFSEAGVLMLTARTDEVDKVVGLSVGADDYVTKPFSDRELLARVGAILRRLGREPAPSVLPEGLVVDTAGRRVTAHGVELPLTRIEFDLLATLVEQPGRVVSRAELLRAVWGDDWFGDDHVIDVHMGNLRRKLGEPLRRCVATVRGVGYRLQAV